VDVTFEKNLDKTIISQQKIYPFAYLELIHKSRIIISLTIQDLEKDLSIFEEIRQ